MIKQKKKKLLGSSENRTKEEIKKVILTAHLVKELTAKKERLSRLTKKSKNKMNSLNDRLTKALFGEEASLRKVNRT